MGRSWRNQMSSNDYSSPAVRAPSAVAGVISPSHNGVSDSNAAPSIPKYNQIVPQSLPSYSCWNNSQVQVDIIVDKSVGKAVDYFLEFDVTFSNSAASPGTAYLPSAAAFIDHYDILYNGSVIDTIYVQNLFMEGMVMKTDQELKQHAAVWGIAFDASGNPIPSSISVAASADKTNATTYYLPLVGSVPSAQLFIAGIKGEIRFRLYLASKPLSGVAPYASTSTVSVGLKNLTLWVEEASVSESTFAAMVEQHKMGINYRSIYRTLWQRTNTLVNTSPQTDILNAFSNDSAGLLVFVTANSLDTRYIMSRVPLKNLQLLDAGGATLTRTLGASLVNNVITTSQTPVGSPFQQNPDWNLFFIPFCTNLDRCLHSGKVLGGLKLSGQEQLTINVDSNPGAAILENVLSFDYLAMRVQNGVLQWSKTAGDIPGWSSMN